MISISGFPLLCVFAPLALAFSLTAHAEQYCNATKSKKFNLAVSESDLTREKVMGYIEFITRYSEMSLIEKNDGMNRLDYELALRGLRAFGMKAQIDYSVHIHQEIPSYVILEYCDLLSND